MSTAMNPPQEGSDLKHKVNELEEKVSARVGELNTQLQSTKDRVHDLNEQAVQFIQERPLAAIGIALGAGYLLGKLASSRWLV